MKDIAFGAAHDEGWAGHLREAFSKAAPFSRVRLTHLLKPPAVVFPGPGSVGLLPQIVHEAAAQDFRVAPRVEGERPLDNFVERFRLGSTVHKVADAARPRTPDLGAGIDHYKMGEPFRIVDCKGERIDRAHRHPGQDEIVEAERIDKTFDVLTLRRNRIIGVGRPVGVTMPTLIERNTVKFVAQCEAAEIPGMRRQSAAMEKKKRPQPLVAPVEITKSKMTDEHGLFVRQYDLFKAKAGAYRGGLEVIVILVGG